MGNRKFGFLNVGIPVQGFPGDLEAKESARNAGDLCLLPGSGRSPGEETGYPLQCSCLENSMEGEVWQATVHGLQRVRCD